MRWLLGAARPACSASWPAIQPPGRAATATRDPDRPFRFGARGSAIRRCSPRRDPMCGVRRARRQGRARTGVTVRGESTGPQGAPGCAIVTKGTTRGLQLAVPGCGGAPRRRQGLGLVRDRADPGRHHGRRLRRLVRHGDTLSTFEHDRQGRSIQIDEDLYLVSGETPEPGDMLNHSCEPSCGLVGASVLVAMRDIEVGEELTFDYATCDSSDYDEFECLCGEPTCRGVVTGPGLDQARAAGEVRRLVLPLPRPPHRRAARRSLTRKLGRHGSPGRSMLGRHEPLGARAAHAAADLRRRRRRPRRPGRGDPARASAASRRSSTRPT